METVFYDEAAELLGISVDAIRHSVSGKRKALTVLPRQGQKQRLVKEQVMLFKGKRLSLSALSMQERKTWERYASEAYTNTLPASGEEMIRALARQEVEQQLAPLFEEVESLEAEEAAKSQELAAIQGKKEGFRKALSLLRGRVAAIA